MLKIGVFGAGRLGKSHLDNWKKIEGIQLTGFYEPSDPTAREVIKMYGLKRFNTADQLINACDVADITASPKARYSLSKKAILKSRHVMIEKPMADSMEHAREIVQLAREANIRLMVGNLERFNPVYHSIEKEDFHPLMIIANRYEALDDKEKTDVVLDLMIDDIDIVLSLVKSDVKNVSAHGVGVFGESADIVNARLEFDNGCIASMTSSRIAAGNETTMHIYGKGGHTHLNFLEKGTGSSNPVRLQLESFKDAVLQKSRPLVSEVDGLRSMQVAHLILDKIGRNTSR